MNRQTIKATLLKLGSLLARLLIAVWVWLRTQIYPWARQHPVVCTVVLAIIAHLWLSAAAERRREFRNWPTNEEVRRIVQKNDPKAEELKPPLLEDPEKRAQQLGWDPLNEATPAKYKLPAKLTEPETRRLIADLHCVSDFYDTRAKLYSSYSNIYTFLQRSGQVIYERIESQRGFHYPELCYRWYEFIDAGDAKEVFILPFGWADSDYIRSRVSQIRFRIIGGQHTVGDVKFVSVAIQNVIDEYKQYEPRTRRAMQIRDWMTNERLLISPYTPDVIPDNQLLQFADQLKTPLDLHPDLQAYVNETYRKYHGDDGTPPQINP